jgi:uncharacterized protein (TIGR03067 family)
VASTIKAASLLAAGRAPGVISAKVAALTEGVVKAMFVTKIKGVLAVVLVIATLAGAAGLICQTQAAGQPKEERPIAKKNQKKGEEKPAQPKQQPAKSDRERMVGNWFLTNDDSMRKGEMWVITDDSILMNAKNTSPITNRYVHRLEAGKDPKQIDITVTLVNGPPVGVIKGLYVLDGDELRLCLAALGKDRPAAFAEKPGPGEVLILHRSPPSAEQPKAKEEQQKKGAEKQAKEKLRVLIDKVLAAHGGEDKLNKLQFTMTVKVDNGTTDQYFVQPPKHFRWESQHRDSTTKRICILLPNGRQWWLKNPNEEAKPIVLLGAELPMAYHLDHVKFFGPRQVLRLKDADHRVALLDEEVRIDGRAAVGVEVTGPQCNRRMYFDKETHLLVKQGETYYCDYKKFDGIPIARKEKHPHAGTGAWEAEVTAFRAVDKFDAKVFEQP